MRALSFLTALLLFSAGAVAASKTQEKRAAEKAASLPYLGPGADKLSPEEYERVYKNYIQTSILLGYPFYKEKAPACEQALNAIFRSAGMFSYPVPPEAQQIVRTRKNVAGHKLENYELAGFLLQLSRSEKTGAFEQLVLVNSSSVKATRRLVSAGKLRLLQLEKDPVTGLERVQGIPVGYPNPFLTADGQGLYVKILKFNGKLEGCEPLNFLDNAWVGGFDLSEARCTELQSEAEKVWNEKLSPSDFSDREIKRMKELALKSALEKGTKEAEARVLIEKHFVPPLTNEINVVGGAMRNLAQCNLLALGRGSRPKAGGSGTGVGETSSPGEPGTGSGTAK